MRSVIRRLLVLAAVSLAVSCGPSAVYVHFDSGMEGPRGSDDRAAIDNAVGVLQSHPELNAAVIGHTDNQGTEGLNKQLSLRRARTVRDQMVKHIDPKRIVVAARGDFVPVGDNTTEEGRAQNRRVEIFFYDPKGGELSSQYGARIEIHVQ
jgi:outer membrane protein OmpA-like peptidoglycan-associated protein